PQFAAELSSSAALRVDAVSVAGRAAELPSKAKNEEGEQPPARPGWSPHSPRKELPNGQGQDSQDGRTAAGRDERASRADRDQGRRASRHRAVEDVPSLGGGVPILQLLERPSDLVADAGGDPR